MRALLESLVGAWAQSPGQLTRYTLVFELGDVSDSAALPRELMLAVYRISQEALTNVARHAGASRAVLQVRVGTALQGDGQAGDRELEWSVEDDGCGLANQSAWQRGNGLAGIQERVWAAGGDLQWGPLDVHGLPWPGLRLSARLPWPIKAVAPAGPPPVAPEAAA